jgi:hypothetical protein
VTDNEASDVRRLIEMAHDRCHRVWLTYEDNEAFTRIDLFDPDQVRGQILEIETGEVRD